jgi:predicted porin
MKKTLVLASLLAAFGAASAQSSVTLAGVADAWLGQTKSSAYTLGTLNAGSGLTQTAIGSGGQNGTRLTVRGSEALGNGMNAMFHLESGHQIDTGTQATTGQFFGRQAFVGVNGGFGTVSLGRQYTSYDDARGGNDVLGHTAFSATVGSAGAWANGRDYLFRLNNSIKFSSASYSGFSFSATHGFGEDKTATTSASSVTALHARYAAGPVVVAVAMQNEKAPVGGTPVAGSGGAGALAAGATSESHTLVAASYNLGFAKLTAEYNTSKDNATGSKADKELAFGANIPFGVMSVDLGFATSKVDGVNKAQSVGAHLNYNLSPRTRVYAGMTNGKRTNATATNSTVASKASLVAVGLRHSF